MVSNSVQNNSHKRFNFRILWLVSAKLIARKCTFVSFIKQKLFPLNIRAQNKSFPQFNANQNCNWRIRVEHNKETFQFNFFFVWKLLNSHHIIMRAPNENFFQNPSSATFHRAEMSILIKQLTSKSIHETN